MTILRVVIKDTIEERIIDLQDLKSLKIRRAMGEPRKDTLTLNEMVSLLTPYPDANNDAEQVENSSESG